MAIQTDTPTAPRTELSFPVVGMTCASGVRRIEKALNRVDGVHAASVNLATEQARVTYDPAVASPQQMQAAIEKAGYTIGAPAHAAAPGTRAATESAQPVSALHDLERLRELDDLQHKWTVSLVAGLAMM